MIQGKNCESQSVTIRIYKVKTYIFDRLSKDELLPQLYKSYDESLNKFRQGEKIKIPVTIYEQGTYYAKIYAFSGSGEFFDPELATTEVISNRIAAY